MGGRGGEMLLWPAASSWESRSPRSQHICQPEKTWFASGTEDKGAGGREAGAGEERGHPDSDKYIAGFNPALDGREALIPLKSILIQPLGEMLPF